MSILAAHMATGGYGLLYIVLCTPCVYTPSTSTTAPRVHTNCMRVNSTDRYTCRAIADHRSGPRAYPAVPSLFLPRSTHFYALRPAAVSFKLLSFDTLSTRNSSKRSTEPCSPSMIPRTVERSDSFVNPEAAKPSSFFS